MKLIYVAAFLLFVCAVFGRPSEDKKLFNEYIRQYNKQYNSGQEYQQRFQNFRENVKEIEALNKKFNPQSTYSINQFTDMNKEEFRLKRTNGGKITSQQEYAKSCLANGAESPVIPNMKIPQSFDWRDHNVVTPVKDQGDCGSCWTFSTSGAIESATAIKTGKLVGLSEQMIVDCSVGCTLVMNTSVCNQGCDGGWMWTAMNDVIGFGGLETETAYPYTAEDGTCSYSKSLLQSPISNYTCLSGPNAADEDDMAAFLVNNGPLSIAMDADLLFSYSSGIIVPEDGDCDPDSLDHALLIVGYNNTGSTPYWIIKNSWNQSWGENGYFRIAKGEGSCGLNNAVVFPIVESSRK